MSEREGHLYPMILPHLRRTAREILSWSPLLGLFPQETRPFGVTGRISVGSMLGAASCPVTNAFRGGMRAAPEQIWIVTIFLSIMALTVILMHRENIVRLLKGQEQRFSFKKKDPSG